MTEQQPEAPAVPGVTRWQVRGPVFVEAIQWNGENEAAVSAFVGKVYAGYRNQDEPGFVIIRSTVDENFVARLWSSALGDWMSVPVGWYVCKGVTGLFFTLAADSLAATYEPAGETRDPGAAQLPLAAALGRAEGRLSVTEDILAAVRQRARDWASIAPEGPQSPVLADAGRWILAIIGTEGPPPDVREYRVLVDYEDEGVVLIGPCAHTIGCLFDRKFPDEDVAMLSEGGVTLGALIDAAAEHEGEQGQQAHALVAELAAETDAAAAEHSTEGDAGHAP